LKTGIIYGLYMKSQIADSLGCFSSG